MCWALQSHKADCSSVIVTKKHFAKGHPEYFVLSPLIITVVVFIVVVFSLVDAFLLSHCGCIDLFKCKYYMKTKET